ncbi:MAG TPA: glycosyltransferase family 9 protein [Bacteroidota bacterium]
MNFLLRALRSAVSGKQPVPLRRDDVRSVIVVELMRLGDVLVIIPSLHLLRSSFPSATLHLFLDEHHASLIESLDIDIVVHEVPNSQSLRAMFGILEKINILKGDIALSMSPSKRNAFAVLSSRAKVIGGYLEGGGTPAPFLYRWKIEMFGTTMPTNVYANENIYLRPWKVCETLGLSDGLSFIRSSMRPVPRESAEEELRAMKILPKTSFIILHPFSAWEFRSWPLQDFVELARSILVQTSHDVLFLCHVDESDQMSAPRETFRFNKRVHFFASRDLIHTAVLMSNAEAFVGNDSGPLHLAAALGIKHVGLFGPADPRLTAPPTAHGVHCYKKVECSPCDQRQCIRPDDSCMELISVDDVARPLLEMLVKDPVVDV